MKSLRSSANRQGFTLIELLIVIVVIAVLALIIIPRLLNAGKKAKDAALRADLQQLRSAVEQFQSDATVYPASLSDLEAAATTVPNAGGTVGSTTVPAGGAYNGPYMPVNGGINGKGLPVNPYIGATDMTVSDHWTYPASSGTVTCPTTIAGSTFDGVPYSNL